MAIGIEAFNRFSRLQLEEKSKNEEQMEISPKASRQEEEVSAVTKFSSIQNVREIIHCLCLYLFTILAVFIKTAQTID